MRKSDNARYQTNKDHERIVRVARQYKISREEAARLEAVAACKICFAPLAAGQRAVDHCHKTDVVRGVLCHRCNLTLGKLGDDADLARRMADYLDHRRA